MPDATATSILIVEDDAFLSTMYADKFEAEGFIVHSATTGPDAIKIAGETMPDVILLDVMLPQMDGFGVLEKLKADQKTRAIPVLLLTNLSQKEDVDRGRQLGAVDFLIKAHFMPNEVVKKVRAALGQHSA
jgi:DNA-binding response OmpR family regulator